MGSRTWIKIYCDQWLNGTIRGETPELRGIWVDLLVIAGSSKYGDSGEIKITELVGYFDKQLAHLLQIPHQKWVTYKKKLIETDRILVSENNIIAIKNWTKYQSEYNRQKAYRLPQNTLNHSNSKLQPEVTPKSPTKSTARDKRVENRERDRDSIYRPLKQKLGEFQNVLLTTEEYGKLVSKLGERGANDWISSLSEWLKSTSKVRRDHYATILIWERREQKEKGGTGGTHKGHSRELKPRETYKSPEEHRQTG